MQTDAGGIEAAAPEVRKPRAQTREADLMSATASTRAPTEAKSRRADNCPSPDDEDDLMFATNSIDVLGRIEDELEADDLLQEASPTFSKQADYFTGLSARNMEGLNFDLMDEARGGFMDVNFASNDLFDLNVEPACQMLDLSLALSFDDMDEPAAFGVNKLGMRQISFDALPMMQAPISAEEIECTLQEQAPGSSCDPTAAEMAPRAPTPPQAPLGERPLGGFRHIHRRPAPATPTSEDAASSRTRSRARSDASTDSMAGAAGAALLRYRRMVRN